MTKLLSAPADAPNPFTHAAPPFDDGYRVLFECNPTPMWVFDRDTRRFLAVNAAAVAEYGYPPDTFLSLTIRDVFAERDRARFDGLAGDGDAKDLYAGRWDHRRSDGTSLQVEILCTNLPFQGHRARLIHVTNVTARLEAEAARRESEQLLHELVESSDDAILSKSLDGAILTWNAAAERMYGYTATEAIGASIYTIVPPEDHQELAASMQHVREGARIPPFEATRLHKDGHRLWVWVAISPILNDAGVVVGISAIARDITQRKAMEDQLRQTQRMEAMGSLAGGIAHDFNNLLTVINGMAELVIEELEPASRARADVEEIRLAGQSATLLTRQLLTFSRKGIVQEAVVDVNHTVTRLDTILQRTLGDDVEFILRQRPDLWCIRGDPGHIEQVLMNLVINARDAMPDGGMLTVETDQAQLDESFVATHAGAVAGEFVRLSVTDTGCGMTPEVRARIFEPFFTTKGLIKGTGLGLSTVLGIVQQAAGFIAVATKPGAGSTFSVYWPRSADDRAPVTASAALPISNGTETILLVEDDHRVRALNARGLRQRGYTLLLARHAADAMRVAAQYGGPIDLLLTDLVMPGANGHALAELLSQSIRNLKVLYTSGYTDSVAVLSAVRASSAHFIQKPYSPDALARKVRGVLDAEKT